MENTQKQSTFTTMADADLSPEARLQEQARNIGRIDLDSQIDKSYRSIINNFQKYVDEGRANGRLDTASIYTTRQAIDSYCINFVAKKDIMPANARKYILAISKLAEYEHHGDDTDFTVESPLTKRALDAQRQTYLLSLATRNGAVRLVCPRKNLPTNVLTHDDNMKAIHFALMHRPDWHNITFVWSWGICAFLRGASARVLKLSDIIDERAHAPKNETMLCAVLRKGPIHKDRHERHRVVGSWRHRNYLLCAQGHLAAAMLYRLTMKGEGGRLSFDVRQHHAESPNFWRNVPIVEWDTLADESGPVEYILEKCGISATKVTHFRKSAIDYAGTEGLAEESIATMTKHSSKKLTKCYMPELKKDVLEVMAGFTNGEKYYVPRSLIFDAVACPWTPDQVTSILFPDLPRWEEEIQSVHGDTNEGSIGFIAAVIPTMAKIIFQDGIYWVRDFPIHPISQFLLSKFQGYDRWAIVARSECDRRQKDIEEDAIKALTEAAAAAFNVVARKQDSLEALSKEQHQEILARVEYWGSTNNQLLRDIFQHVSRGDRAAAAPAQAQVVSVPAQPQPLAHIAPRTGTGTGTGRGHMEQSATNMLRYSGARVPPIDGTLPRSMADILLQHNRLNLQDYVHITGKQRLWGRPIALAYGKRAYLIKKIHERAREDLSTNTVAAAALDRERGPMSLPKYHDLLRDRDPSIRRRPGGQGPRTVRVSHQHNNNTNARRRHRQGAMPTIPRTQGGRTYAAAVNQVTPTVPTAAAQARQAAANTFVQGIVGHGTAIANV